MGASLAHGLGGQIEAYLEQTQRAPQCKRLKFAIGKELNRSLYLKGMENETMDENTPMNKKRNQERSNPMFKLTLRYVRYALSALATIGFGVPLN